MNSHIRQACGHPRVAETKGQAPQFSNLIEDGKRYDLEQVVNWPLAIDRSAKDGNWLSPVPLDPKKLKIGGVAYENYATLWISERLDDHAQGLTEDQYEQATGELFRQFDVRTKHSIASMDRLHEFAASDANRVRIDHEMARRVMQLRAGVAQPSAAVGMLAAVPSIGGLEFIKTTCPCCFEQYDRARGIMRASIPHLRNSGNLRGIKVEAIENGRPYRFGVENKHNSIIAKELLGRLMLGNVAMEVVARDTYIVGEEGSFKDSVETRPLHGGMEATPLDTSAYVRVPEKWFETQDLALPTGYGRSSVPSQSL